MKHLKWGILSTGRIAATFARDLANSDAGEVVAVASRNQATADAFATTHQIPRAYHGYDELLQDESVEAVYIAPPHPIHAKWAIRAAEAGKHILCEKPIGMNRAETEEILEVVEGQGVFLMEAFMYRCHPQIQAVIDIIRSGEIGDVKLISAAFSFPGDPVEDERLFGRELGGGAILDVGCYCTSFARLIAGVAVGQPFMEPIEFRTVGHVGPGGVDEYAVASLTFPGKILAQLSTSIRYEQEMSARVFGTKGRVSLRSPWLPQRDGRRPEIEISLNDAETPEVREVSSDRGLYELEALAVAEAVGRGAVQAAWPAMTWEDTLGNMAVLDRWRSELGIDV